MSLDFDNIIVELLCVSMAALLFHVGSDGFLLLIIFSKSAKPFAIFHPLGLFLHGILLHIFA